MDLNATARDIRERFGSSLQKASDAHGVPVDLLAAIAAVESNGNPSAVSPKGAMGLFQFMPATAMDYGLDDRTDPDKSAMAAGKFYADLLRRYNGNVDLAVAAGNAGPGKVDSGEYLSFRETVQHMERVREAMGRPSDPTALTGERSWEAIQAARGRSPMRGEITDQKKAAEVFALANIQSASLRIPDFNPDPQAVIELAERQDSGFMKRYILGGAKSAALGFFSMVPASMSVLGAAIDKVADDVAMRDVTFDQLATTGLTWNKWLEEHLAVENPNLYHQLMGAAGNMAWFGGGGLLAARGASLILAGERSLAPALVAKIGDAIGLGVMSTLESAVEQGDAIQRRMDRGMSASDALEDSKEVFQENMLLTLATNAPYWSPGSRLARMAIEAVSEGPIQERAQKAIQDVADGTGKWGDFFDYHYAWQEGLVGAIVGGVAAGIITPEQSKLPKEGKDAPTHRLEDLVTQAEAEAGIAPPTDEATLGQRVEAILAQRRKVPARGGEGTAARIGEILGAVRGGQQAAAQPEQAPQAAQPAHGADVAVLPQDDEREQRRAKLDALGDEIETEMRFLQVQDAVGRVLGTEVDLSERLSEEQLADVRERIKRAFSVTGEAHQRYAVQQLVMKVRGMLLGTSPATTEQEMAAGRQELKDQYNAAKAAELQRRAEEREAKAAAAELMAQEVERRRQEEALKAQGRKATKELSGNLAEATMTQRPAKVVTPLEAIETVRKHLEEAYQKKFKMSELGDQLDSVAAEAAAAMNENDPVLRARLFDRVAERAEGLLLDREAERSAGVRSLPKPAYTVGKSSSGQQIPVAPESVLPNRDVAFLGSPMDSFFGIKFKKVARNAATNYKALEVLANILDVRITFFEQTQDGDIITQTMGATAKNKHVMINVNRGPDDSPMVATLGHEVLHNLELHYPAEYKKLYDMVAATGVFQTKLAEIQSNLSHYPSHLMEEEFLADIVGQVVNSEAFLRKLAEQDMPLLRRLYKEVQKVVAQVKASLASKAGKNWAIMESVLTDVQAFEDKMAGIIAEFAKGRAEERVQEIIRRDRAARVSKLTPTERVAKAKADAAAAAAVAAPPGSSATPMAAPAMHVDANAAEAVFEQAVTSEAPSEVRLFMSYRTLEAHKAKLMKFLSKKSGMAEEEIMLAWPQIEALAAELEKHPELNTPFAEPGTQSPLPNNLFEKSRAFELSGNCPNSAEYRATLDAIEERLAKLRPQKPMLSSDELMAMAFFFRSAGKVAPCHICYVEAVRRKKNDAVNAFISGVGKNPKKTPRFMNAKSYPHRARIMKKYGAIPADIFTNNEKYRKMPEYAGLAAEVTRYAQGAAFARSADKRNAEYSGDWLGPHGAGLTAKQRAKYDARGRGPRFSGSNDFVIDQVIDWMQGIVDLAAQGMPAYVYTKMNDMVQIFHKTGININQSVAVRLKEGQDPATARPDLENGMDWADAKRNRGLGRNVGTVLVAVNDAQIKWGLDQDWIDIVIPGHHSGVSKEQLALMGWKRYDGKPGRVYVERTFGSHPNYDKIKNDVRDPSLAMTPVKPIFDFEYAQRALSEFYAKGGAQAITAPNQAAVKHAVSEVKKGREAFDRSVIVEHKKELEVQDTIPTLVQEAMNPAVRAANSTSRTAGAVGPNAITPRYISETAAKGETILDFGAGKDASHAARLRNEGHDVTAYEFGDNSVPGVHDSAALGRQYDTVYASNVLNVQSSKKMLVDTLRQIRSATKGRAVFNYPASPRYLSATNSEVAAAIESVFGSAPVRVGGTSSAPLWEVRVGGVSLSYDRNDPSDTEEMAHFRGRYARATEKEKKTGRQVLVSIYDWVRTAMVTRDHPLYSLVARSLKRIGQNVHDFDWSRRPDLVLRATRTWVSQGNLALKKGVYAIGDASKLIHKSLEDIVAEFGLAPWIDSGHFQQFWQAADHVARHDVLGDRYFPSADVDHEAHAAAVKEYQLYKRLYDAYAITHPTWVTAVDSLTKFSNAMLMRMHQAGILSEKEYKDITEKFDVFSPMEVLDIVEHHFQSDDSAIDRESKVVRARGLFEAGKVRADPFNSLIKNVYRVEFHIALHTAHMSQGREVADLQGDVQQEHQAHLRRDGDRGHGGRRSEDGRAPGGSRAGPRRSDLCRHARVPGEARGDGAGGNRFRPYRLPEDLGHLLHPRGRHVRGYPQQQGRVLQGRSGDHGAVRQLREDARVHEVLRQADGPAARRRGPDP